MIASNSKHEKTLFSQTVSKTVFVVHPLKAEGY